jgi:competence protein ComGC
MDHTRANPPRKRLAIASLVPGIISIPTFGLIFIACIATPNLRKSQQAARNTDAFKAVVTIHQAQVLYASTKGRGGYATLRVLGAEGLIDSALASGEKGGYLFSSEPVPSQSTPMFDTTAKPAHAFGTGNRSFGSNETGVVYESAGKKDLKGTPTNRVPADGTPVP